MTKNCVPIVGEIFELTLNKDDANVLKMLQSLGFDTVHLFESESEEEPVEDTITEAFTRRFSLVEPKIFCAFNNPAIRPTEMQWIKAFHDKYPHFQYRIGVSDHFLSNDQERFCIMDLVYSLYLQEGEFKIMGIPIDEIDDYSTFHGDFFLVEILK